MNEYHKIQTVYKRDPNTKKIIIGDYSLPEFGYLSNNDWVLTEKVDGTNTRIMWAAGTLVFGGKTDNSQMPVKLLYKLQELFEGTAKKKLFKDKFGESDQVILYGEGFGGNIQGQTGYGDFNFVLFDVKINDIYLERENVLDIANYFGIQIVPIVLTTRLDIAIEMVKKGFRSHWGEFNAEGIVARPMIELQTRRGERIITKIKHKDFK